MMVLKVKVEGKNALLMHNKMQLANPSSAVCKKMEEITKKDNKNKSDADRLELARLEFMGSLYLNNDGKIILPSRLLHGAINKAARRFKEGTKCRANVVPDSDLDFTFEGPTDPNERWAAQKYHLTEPLRIGGKSMVVRTRPMFNKWKADFTLLYDEKEVNKKQIEKWVKVMGRFCGFGDSRPEFGLFNIIEMTHEVF